MVSHNFEATEKPSPLPHEQEDDQLSSMDLLKNFHNVKLDTLIPESSRNPDLTNLIFFDSSPLSDKLNPKSGAKPESESGSSSEQFLKAGEKLGKQLHQENMHDAHIEITNSLAKVFKDEGAAGVEKAVKQLNDALERGKSPYRVENAINEKTGERTLTLNNLEGKGGTLPRPYLESEARRDVERAGEKFEGKLSKEEFDKAQEELTQKFAELKKKEPHFSVGRAVDKLNAKFEKADSPYKISVEENFKTGESKLLIRDHNADKTSESTLVPSYIQRDFVEAGQKLDSPLDAKELEKVHSELTDKLSKVYKEEGKEGLYSALRQLRENLKKAGSPYNPYPGENLDTGEMKLKIKDKDSGQTHEKILIESKVQRDFAEAGEKLVKKLSPEKLAKVQTEMAEKLAKVHAKEGDDGISKAMGNLGRRLERATVANNLSDSFGKDLDEKDRDDLNKAFKAALSGDVDSLKKMVPYAKNMMDFKATDAFVAGLKSIGYQVDTDGIAASSPYGERRGSITIVPPGSNEGLRLSYQQDEGRDAKPVYSVEAVTVSPGEQNRLTLSNISTDRETVKQRVNVQKEKGQEIDKAGKPVNAYIKSDLSSGERVLNIQDQSGTIHPKTFVEATDQKRRDNSSDQASEKSEKSTEKARTELVDSATSAVKSGDLKALQKVLTDMFNSVKGERYEFVKFTREFAEQMKKEGITVRFADGKQADTQLSIHRDGSPYGIDLTVSWNSRSGQAEVKTQTYDWVTKENVVGKLTETMKDFHDRKQNDGLKDGKELGAAVDEAIDKKDFSTLNKALAAAFTRAYQSGGITAVKELERVTDRATETNGVGAVALEENGTLKIITAKRLTSSEKEEVEGMSAKEVQEKGYVKHPTHGFMKVLNRGPAPISKRSK